MKIFALYIKLDLVKKPDWFNEFLKKYFELVDLHVTLIQPRYIDEKEIDNLQSKITKIVENLSLREVDRNLYFGQLVIDKESDGKYIFMLNAKENNFLINFQKELRESLENYSEYVDASTKEYEINFKPHITIAVNLDVSTKEEAEKYFVSDYMCEGLIETLVLPIVKDTSIEERTNTNNLRIFQL